MKREDLRSHVKYDRMGSALVKIPGVGVKNLSDDPDYDMQTASPPLETRMNASGQKKPMSVDDEPMGSKSSGKDKEDAAMAMMHAFAKRDGYGVTEEGGKHSAPGEGVAHTGTHEVAPYGADEHDEDEEEERADTTPEGFENVVRALKDNPNVENPWAIAWSMKNKGDTPHK